MPKCKTPKYEGVLAEPMKLPPEGGINEFGERLVALKEHYGVEKLDEFGLMELVLSLARDHVPGFHFERETTHLFSDRAARDLDLLVQVFKRTEQGMSVKRAAEMASKHHPSIGLTPESARVRYQELKNQNSDRGRKAMWEVVKFMKIRQQCSAKK